MAISVDVFKHSLGDCTNGGVTSQHRTFLLVGADEQVPHGNKLPVLRVRVQPSGYVFAKPEGEDIPPGHSMAGGNFVYTNDSRYRDVTGISYPISVHDRFER